MGQRRWRALSRGANSPALKMKCTGEMPSVCAARRLCAPPLESCTQAGRCREDTLATVRTWSGTDTGTGIHSTTMAVCGTSVHESTRSHGLLLTLLPVIWRHDGVTCLVQATAQSHV